MAGSFRRWDRELATTRCFIRPTAVATGFRSPSTSFPWTSTEATVPELFFFADRLNGWIWWMYVPEARIIFSRTQDGGRTWQSRETVESGNHLAFFDPLHGYALSSSSEAGAALLTTENGGDTWSEHALPFSWADCASFTDRSAGFVVGSDKEARTLATVTTADGGKTWKNAGQPFPADARVIDWSSDSHGRGWLVLWLSVDGGSQLFQTVDGGATWSRHPEQLLQGPRRWLDVVRFATERVGFAFVASGTRSRDVFLTQDGGTRWIRAHRLRSRIADCGLFQGQLWCGAGMDVLNAYSGAS